MTVTFTLTEAEIREALKNFVESKHPEFKGKTFKPTRVVKTYSFQIGDKEPTGSVKEKKS